MNQHTKQILNQLLEEFNIAPESKYGGQIALDKNYFEKLAKYNLKILYIVLQKLNEEKDGIFKDILDRRQEGGKAKNLVCGFNVMDDCIKNIIMLIAEKEYIEQNDQHRETCDKLYNKNIADLISILKYVAAMVVIFIILLIFDYAYKWLM